MHRGAVPMARHCVAGGHASSTARASRGGTSRRENAGDVLGSRRTGRGFYRERAPHRVKARADGIAATPKDNGQARERRRDRKAFCHAYRHQRAGLPAVRNGRRLIRTTRHVVGHRKHNGDSRRHVPAHRRGERSGNEPQDREDREQLARMRPEHRRTVSRRHSSWKRRGVHINQTRKVWLWILPLLGSA